MRGARIYLHFSAVHLTIQMSNVGRAVSSVHGFGSDTVGVIWKCPSYSFCTLASSLLVVAETSSYNRRLRCGEITVNLIIRTLFFKVASEIISADHQSLKIYLSFEFLTAAVSHPDQVH